MKKLTVLVAGIALGGVLMLALPSSAHHRSELRRLRSRVADTERQIATLKSQVTDLQTRAQYLNDEGTYTALVAEQQVVSTGCAEGDDAVWDESGFDLRFLSCSIGRYRASGVDGRLYEGFLDR